MTVDVLDPETQQITAREIDLEGPGGFEGAFRLPHGAGALLVVLREQGTAVFAAEVAGRGGETVSLRIARAEQGRYSIFGDQRNVYYLQPNGARSRWLRRQGSACDLAILVDGTMVGPGDIVSSLPALLETAAWEEMAGRIAEFAGSLAAAVPGLRTAIVAFGDHAMPPLTRRGYVTWPDARQAVFRPWRDEEDLRSQLRAVPPADGADFVDALADGFHACRQLPWRPDARKLVMLVGDSPGYSIEEAALPELRMSDARVRELDVFEQADALFDMGVEVAAIQSTVASLRLVESEENAARLLDYTRGQYARAASLPDWMWPAGEFDPRHAARQWLEHREVIARGECAGYWAGR
jgi:hypothetical protein